MPLSRLSQSFGIKGTALNWFSPYLSEGKQFVCVNGTASSHRDLPYGVPLGSVLARALCYSSCIQRRLPTLSANMLGHRVNLPSSI